MTKRERKSKQEKTKFTAKQQRLMVEDFQDLVDSTVQQLQSGLHLEQYKHWRQFARVICDEAAKKTLVACILEMVLAILDMYRSQIKGKRWNLGHYSWTKCCHDKKYHCEHPQSHCIHRSVTTPQIWLATKFSKVCSK